MKRTTDSENTKAYSYGAFREQHEYDEVQKKRQKASSMNTLRITIALALSLIVGTVTLISLFLSPKEPNDESVIESDERLGILPTKDNEAFPDAMLCMSKVGFYGVPISYRDAYKYNIPQGFKITVLSEKAAMSGLRYNDILVYLDDKAVNTVTDINRVLTDFEEDAETSVSVFRDGRYIWYRYNIN